MSLHILHSNRVETLLQDLALQIARPHPEAGLLDGDIILLDNRVLGSWINLQLAMKNSVAANIRYVQLADNFWELSRALVSSDIPKQTPMGKTEMTWRLMGLLEKPEILNHKDLAAVRSYLSDNGQDDKFTELKRFQLAASVADLFDQYLVYRPDWVNQYWDKNRQINPPGSVSHQDVWQNAEAWQRVLWQGLQDQVDVADGLHHRAAIQQQLLEKLSGELDTNSLKFHRLFVFGVTSMPETQLETLMLLAGHVDIYLYLFNPCEFEWFDIRSAREIIKLEQRLDIQHRCGQQGQELVNTHQQTDHPELQHIEVGNPLLAGQAGQVKDFIRLIYEKFDRYSEHAEIQDYMQFQTPGEASLLGCIQREILELNFRGEVAQLAAEDGQACDLPEKETDLTQVPSIHIHNCHSPLREVEVLHDQLLDMFNRDKSLKPRDIVVMMPRVAPYAPYINVVFKSAAKKQQIKYHISDRTLLEESPLLNSFETFLKLPDSRLPLSEVLGLLELPAIQRRFGLDREGFEQLKAWLIDAGVRWGLDANHRTKLGLPAYSEFSWEFGLNRLLAGYAMQANVGFYEADEISGLLQMQSTGSEISPPQILPLDEVEGGSSEILDGFLRFWRTLKTQRSKLDRKQGPSAWKELLNDLLEAFYAPDEDDWNALNIMRRGIEELELASTEHWYDGELALEVVRAMLQPVMQQTAGGKHPWSEGVKFCSLLPMRGVPFKVVYLLGMNMDDYPRRLDQKSFDLMRKDYRPGDRSARTDDRWLFLEALLSARQAFYVSYIGQDMHRNEKREPSVVVAELIGYIRDGYKTTGVFSGSELEKNSFFYTKHPLQPFNPAYFPAEIDQVARRLLSFNQQAFDIARGQLSARKHVEENSLGEQRWKLSPSGEAVELPADGNVVDVSMDDFVLFFTRPWDWYFRRHGVSLNRYEDEVSDEELFELQPGLGPWQVRNSLLEQLNRPGFIRDETIDQAGLEIDRLIAVQKASGGWPMGAAGEKQAADLKKLNQQYLFALAGEAYQMKGIDILVNTGHKQAGSKKATKLRIVGTYKRFGMQFLTQSASKASEKYLLNFYLRLALACFDKRSGIETAMAYFCTNNKGLPVKTKLGGVEFPLLFDQDVIANMQHHTDLIEKLAGLYLQYQGSGLPFLPDLSHALAEDEDERSAVIEESWFGNDFGGDTGVKGDLKQRAYFGSQSALNSDTFFSVSRAVWNAIYEWLGFEEVHDDN